MREFNVSREVAILPLAMYVFGYMIGPLLATPMAELYGRRNVYWISMPCLPLFTIIAAAANNLPTIIIMRFLAGACGSGPFAMGAGISHDVNHVACQVLLTAFRYHCRSMERSYSCIPGCDVLYTGTLSWTISRYPHRCIYYRTISQQLEVVFVGHRYHQRSDLDHGCFHERDFSSTYSVPTTNEAGG